MPRSSCKVLEKDVRRVQAADVELLTDAETDTGDSVSHGCEPCQLGLVDGEVRGAGSDETLFVEDSICR
jgi:hypothetical protein